MNSALSGFVPESSNELTLSWSHAIPVLKEYIFHFLPTIIRALLEVGFFCARSYQAQGALCIWSKSHTCSNLGELVCGFVDSDVQVRVFQQPNCEAKTCQAASDDRDVDSLLLLCLIHVCVCVTFVIDVGDLEVAGSLLAALYVVLWATSCATQVCMNYSITYRDTSSQKAHYERK